MELPMLRAGMRLRMKILVQDAEVTMETLMGTGA
jgi:hypothetical protein